MNFNQQLSQERINSQGRIGRPFTENTKNLYIKRLEKYNPLKFKSNEELLKKIQTDFTNHNTQLGYFSAILAYYETTTIDTNKKENIKFWEDERSKNNDAYQKEKEDGILPKGQEQNMVKKSVITKLIKKTKEDLKLKPEKQLNQILIFLVNYSLYPFRNELATIKLGMMIDFNEEPEKYKEGNWLIMSPKPFSLKYVFNEYKTAGKYQQRVIDIHNPTIRNLYKKFLKTYDIKIGEPVFTLVNNEPMNNLNLTKTLQRYTEKTIGKKISTTILRKIYYGDKYNKEDFEKLKEDAKVAGHSVNTAQNIYII